MLCYSATLLHVDLPTYQVGRYVYMLNLCLDLFRKAVDSCSTQPRTISSH